MNSKKNKRTAILWTASGVLFLGLLFARAVYPEIIGFTVILAVAMVGALVALAMEYKKDLRSRTAAFGFNSLITAVLVIAIVGVLNFLASRYAPKFDLTKNKVHTLSDQTVKLTKGLQKTVKAILFGKMQQREQYRPLLENYKNLSPKFEIEYVDPDREPTRAKQAGIKKYGTLQLLVGTRESKVEDPNEEKITNAMIKVLKDKSPLLCATTDHGEKSFTAADADGYSKMKTALGEQSYEVRDLSLVQEGKVPESCDAIAIMGPTKPFYPQEIKPLTDYLANGGRAIIASDINIKGAEYSPELLQLLAAWNVKADVAMIVDPYSKKFGVDAAAPLLATYAKESPITRDFQIPCSFPFARPLQNMPNPPAGLNVQWLAQTTPNSFAVTDIKELASGAVKFTPGRDLQGPLTAALTVEGKLKDSKASRNTRLVVFGTSFFGTNNYSRFGGNSDLFLNSAAWIMEDESMISIRAKEEGASKVELSQKQGNAIFYVTVFVIPFMVFVTGIVIWYRRRRL